MKKTSFIKTLSANDVGATGAHQAGILVPKTEQELLAFLPTLESSIKNPDTWIKCIDEEGEERKFRYVYYNNRLHDENGTRNEYRLTHMTKYLKEMRAAEGDGLEFSLKDGSAAYSIRLLKGESTEVKPSDEPIRIKITAGWRRAH
jgi:hypothetical protein